VSQRITDPFSVIAKTPPRLTVAQAEALERKHYGLEVTAAALLSERDQNFRLQSRDGRRYVLKIANAAEPPSVTDFQIGALMHIEKRSDGVASPVRTPQVLPTLEGRPRIRVPLDGEHHVVRVVSYLAGTPMADVNVTAPLAKNLGAYLARLGRALSDFEYEGADPDLLWDMKKALQLRSLLTHIAEPTLREQVGECLDEFERNALPQFEVLRSQVIHNDFNPDNVLIDPQDLTRPAGVIDFGDMQKSPLIVDVAVATSYLRLAQGDPLQHILAFVGGYNAVTPLQDSEVEILFSLILTRLCATISILSWRASLRGAEDPYLQNTSVNETSAEDFLVRLLELPRNSATQALRRVCQA
jgi:Ser/Thr protein kinase RdoA (MazF antagonist)